MGKLPIKVEENVNEKEIEKFPKLVKYINAEKGITISSSRKIKEGNVEVRSDTGLHA